MGRIEQNTDMANVADTAVVTGSSSGIGLALSRMLVKNGYEVFGFGRNFERAEAQEFCKEQPEKFHAVVCDITDTQALCAHIKEIDKNYRVTVLVNNAVGGAQVSEKHAGFVINTGNATAADVIALTDAVRDKVFEKYGVKLELEIKQLG